MTTIAPPMRPCIGNIELYDIALYSSRRAPREPVRRAREQAAALCASCSRPCDEPVTPRGLKPGPAATHRPACTFGGCTAPHHAFGLCLRHYAARRRSGTPEGKRRRVDPAVVEQVVAGTDPDRALTRAEREQVVSRLHALGRGDGDIADQLHTTRAVVCRLRHDLGLPAHPSPPQERKPRELDRLRAVELAAMALVAELPDSPAAARLREALAA